MVWHRARYVTKFVIEKKASGTDEEEEEEKNNIQEMSRKIATASGAIVSAYRDCETNCERLANELHEEIIRLFRTCLAFISISFYFAQQYKLKCDCGRKIIDVSL